MLICSTYYLVHFSDGIEHKIIYQNVYLEMHRNSYIIWTIQILILHRIIEEINISLYASKVHHQYIKKTHQKNTFKKNVPKNTSKNIHQKMHKKST